jgi:hypothetical protein
LSKLEGFLALFSAESFMAGYFLHQAGLGTSRGDLLALRLDRLDLDLGQSTLGLLGDLEPEHVGSEHGAERHTEEANDTDNGVECLHSGRSVAVKSR